MLAIDRTYQFSGTNSTNSRLHADYPPSTSIGKILQWRLAKPSTWVDLSIKGLALVLLLTLLVTLKESREASLRAEREVQRNTQILGQLIEAREIIRVQNQRSIDDRAHLNTELDNTRQSLRRLERAVKTGEYP
jgi:hypothetical protein